MRHPLQTRWSEDAYRDMRKLDRRTRERIIHAVERFAQIGHGDIRPLHGETNLYRQRVGNWRIFFEFSDDSRAITILHIRSRGSAYRP